jgi:hypothetical protein
MKKLTLIILVSLSIIVFTAAIVMAGVTELKLYTDENTTVYIKNAEGAYVPSPTGRGSHLGRTMEGLAHVNSHIISMFMHDSMYVHTDAAAGPYAFAFKMNPGGDRYCEMNMYPEYLDVSSTERLTFWVKSAEGNLPLWMVIQNPKGADDINVTSPTIMIAGETIVRQDDFGFHEATALKPWSGEWQFVSIPLTYMHLTADDMEASETDHSLGGIPWSWSGDRYWSEDGAPDRHRGGPYFDETVIKRIKFADFDNVSTIKSPMNVAYPMPAGRMPYWSDFSFDEVVFTLNEGTGVTDVNGKQNVMPLTYELDYNYPNPFNPSTTINYGLPVSNQVLIEVYNTLGQKVSTLVDRYMTAGVYNTTWDATDDDGNFVPSGVYFYKMQSSHFKSIKKMILTK